MAKLVFSVLWTAVVFAAGFAIFREPAGVNLNVATVFLAIFPAVGILAITLSLLEIRRRRSLRRVTEGGVSVYVWIGLDGREYRSCEDPSGDWDGGDGDGDGGGD